jgi:hypothetical protein
LDSTPNVPLAPGDNPEKTVTRTALQDAQEISYQHFHLTDVGAKGTHLKKVDFAYTVITRGYFHNAIFEECSFVGAHLIDCNFRQATLINCDFRYAHISGTRITTEQVLRNLPDEPNIRSELLQILRTNAQELGDTKSARAYILQELAARREHWRRAWRPNGNYYRKKYGGLRNQTLVLLRYIGLSLDSLLWGHGEKVWKIVIPISALIVFAAIISTIAGSSGTTDTVAEVTGRFCDALIYHVSGFLEVASDSQVPTPLWLHWLIAIGRFLTFGVVVSVLFRRLSHR